MRRMLCTLQMPLLFLVLLAVPAAADSESKPVTEPDDRGGVAEAAPPTPEKMAGTVAETMSAEHYTYLLVSTDSRKFWAVGPRTPVAVGDTVALSGGFRLFDFHSGFLDRTFEQIYMVVSIEVHGREEAGSAPQAAPLRPAASEEPPQAGAPVR